MGKFLVLTMLLFCLFACRSSRLNTYHEKYRPQLHFSPKSGWMNDPNGMVYSKGIYHLFFQYYPDSTVWGPMHWGHATSGDLVHWEEKSIALYPDSIGYIFSGSVVADSNNSSGFARGGEIPLVAIYTSHDAEKEKAKREDVQTQSISYSLDDGTSWTKYDRNPVITNPGISDFRDPKVMWYDDEKKWVMTLATKDRVAFYSSKNLKQWEKESDFGNNAGAHGGVWECPDLFYLTGEGRKIWILLVSINPGAPNGGSGTQYFVGDFNGKSFTPFDDKVRWIDYGPDDYAGVTWSATGDRKVFLGWMSNWEYAQAVPTDRWRSAMTIPRDLDLVKTSNGYYLTSQPVPELDALVEGTDSVTAMRTGRMNISSRLGEIDVPLSLTVSLDAVQDFTIRFFNEQNDTLLVGYESSSNHYFIDRMHAGKSDFNENFAGRLIAPRISTSSSMKATLVLDASSLELFADGGLTVMSALVFPEKPYTKAAIAGNEALLLNAIKLKWLSAIH